MQSINPQDQQTTQIQSVDNLVSEIRQIADHIYEEGAQELAQQNGNTHQQNNGEAHSPRTPQYQSVQAPQEPSTHQPEHDALKADAAKQRPPLNPGDISKGLSRLHARVDEVLRRTPQRGLDNSTVFDNLNKPATTGTVRSSLLGETSEAQYRSNVVSIRPEEAYRSSHIVSNYASIPRSSTLPSNTNFAKPPVGIHGQSSSISTTSYPQQQHHYQQQLQHQELPYNNPFSENALLRTGEYDARKSFLQYGVPPATTTSHLTASTVNVAPWNTNIEQIKTQRDDRPFRSPSMLESGIGRGHPAEIGGYNPALRDPRYEQSINSGLGEVHRLSTISTVHGGAPEGGLYQAASVPSFKPRYDRGKLDSIIANIKNREGGSGAASLYQSQAPSVTTSNIYSRVQEPVQHHDIRPSVVVNKQAAFFSGGEPHVPKQTTYESVTRTQQDYLSPTRGLPQATHTPQQQYNQMSSSKFVSPSVQQFSSPQNVIPTSNAFSNPFNQPRHEFETEEAVDYYGVFGQPQREFERERRQGFTPGAGEEHLLHHQLLQQQQHYQHMTPNMTPKQDEVGYRRGGGGYPEQVRGYPDQYQHQQQYQQQQQPYRTPEYDRGYPQQRYREADVYDRYQEPVQDRYNPADRYGSNRPDEFAKRMGPSDIKRGLNRRPDEYAPEVEFGEFQNDDDSLLEDRPPVKAKGRTRKQENPHQFGGLEDDESFVSDRDSFVEQTGPKLRPGRRAASRTRNQNLSHREERPRESGYTDRNMIPKPVTAPRQELVRNTERPSGPSGSTRRGSSARGRRAELGGGDLVYSGTGETGNTNSVQRKQSFGQEQGRGGSVPRRGPGARDPAVNQRTEYPTRDRDVQVKEETPMRGSRVQGQQQYDSERGYGVRSAGGAGAGSQRRDNPKEYLNNEEELSDFDFENRDEVEDNYNRGRGKASQPAARDEDSVTRAFEHARYDSGRKAQGYNAGRDGVSMKTEVIQGGNAGGRRRVGR